MKRTGFILLSLFFAMVITQAKPNAQQEKASAAGTILPPKSKQLIQDHFQGYTIAHVNEDKDWLWTEGYDVFFTNGTKIEFDNKGNWTEIDGQHHSIPTSLVPPVMLAYIRKHYPQSEIVSMEKDKKEYEIQLREGLEIIFHANGTFKRID